MTKFAILFSILLMSSAYATHEEETFDGDEPIEHGSNVLPLKDGGVLLCWYAGTTEANKDVKIYCRQKSKAGIWGNRYKVVEAGYKPKGAWVFKTGKLGNVVLLQDTHGVIYMFWSAIPHSGGFSNSRIDYKYSLDGKTWSKETRIDFDIGAMVKNKPIHLQGDEYALPAYDELGFPNYGYHWKMKLNAGEVKLIKKYKIPAKHQLQPSLVKCGKELCAYLRNPEKGLTFMSRFDQKTEKWGPATETNLPNSNSPVDTILLSSGEILVVYNNRSIRPRAPLSLAVSSDGVKFEKIMDLETNLELDYHYPCLIKDSTGKIHLSYTWGGRDGIKYQSFDEEWLKTNGSWLPAD